MLARCGRRLRRLIRRLRVKPPPPPTGACEILVGACGGHVNFLIYMLRACRSRTKKKPRIWTMTIFQVLPAHAYARMACRKDRHRVPTTEKPRWPWLCEFLNQLEISFEIQIFFVIYMVIKWQQATKKLDMDSAQSNEVPPCGSWL